MNIKDFRQHFEHMPLVEQTANQLQFHESRIQWKGLAGASRSVCAAAVCSQVPGNHLFILNDKEEAAYFLNNFEGLFPENKNILFYPCLLYTSDAADE